MNKYIKSELDRIKSIKLDYNDDTTSIVIPRARDIEINLSSRYLIELENYIVNEPPNFTLSSNWNGGTKPAETKMEVEIIKESGKMVRISGKGITTQRFWEGWVPKKSFKIIAEV